MTLKIVEQFQGGVSGLYAGNPHKLVVPNGKSNWVSIGGAKKGLKVTSSHPKIATAEVNWEYKTTNPLVTVTGHDPGKATITFSQNGASKSFLAIVLPRRKILVNFYMVTDASGKSTRRASASLPRQIGHMNDIYERQAAIYFRKHLTSKVELDIDFGKKMTQQQQNAMLARLQQRVPDSESGNLVWNVFFVRNWGGRDCAGTATEQAKDVLATNWGNICVAGDVTSLDVDGVLLAHEAGHFLGRSGHSGTQQALMYPSAKGNVRVFWDDLRMMRSRF